MSRRTRWSQLALLCARLHDSRGRGARRDGYRRVADYGGDLGSTRYVPHDQINAANFSKLQVAWRFKTDVFGIRADYNLQNTPLMVNGTLYASVGARRDAVAIDAVKQWAFAPALKNGIPVAAWTELPFDFHR